MNIPLQVLSVIICLCLADLYIFLKNQILKIGIKRINSSRTAREMETGEICPPVKESRNTKIVYDVVIIFSVILGLFSTYVMPVDTNSFLNITAARIWGGIVLMLIIINIHIIVLKIIRFIKYIKYRDPYYAKKSEP